jgi:type I restriction enzyme, S subunit
MTSRQKLVICELVSSREAEIKTGPFGTQLKAAEYVDVGTPVINVRNIGFGAIRQSDLEFIDAATTKRLAAHLLRAGDIVFGRKGAVERHAFIRSPQSGWLQGSDCIRLRLFSPSVDPQFISYCLLTEDHKAWMQLQCSHGATMASEQNNAFMPFI